MKISIRFILVAILLLSLAACNNDAATNESSNEKNKVNASEPKEKKNETSTDISGYWKDESGGYYSIIKNDDNYSFKEIGSLELVLKQSNIEDNKINTTITEVSNTDNLTMPKEMIPDYLSPGKEVNFELSGNNEKLSFELLGEPVEITKVDNSNKVDPLDLVGNWMDEQNYSTITKDNDVITVSFEDGVEEGDVQFHISAEITDVIENFVIGKVTKILPEKYANYDGDLHLGTLVAFRLSDDKTKLSFMGDSEMTKTDMSFEEFKALLPDTE